MCEEGAMQACGRGGLISYCLCNTCAVPVFQIISPTTRQAGPCKDAMDVLKNVLAARADKSPQVEDLLQCLSGLDLQVCICSVGGVGSTELSNFLTQAGLRCNLLTDQDAIRHVNRPPNLCGGTKVVYLFGDPLAAVASHYRRKHALHQAQKTCGAAHKLDPNTFPQTFEQYVERGEDLFGFEQHLSNWLHTPSSYEVLFVRYEAMFDPPVAQAMFDYLCPPQHSQQQPSSSSTSAAPRRLDPQQLAATFVGLKRQRASRVTEQQRQMMYTQLTAQMDALPNIFIRTASCEVQPLVPTAVQLPST